MHSLRPPRRLGSAIRAGLDPTLIAPHSLRRTFATDFPCSDRDCQELMGHADLATTQIYRHSRDERKRQAVDAMHYGKAAEAEKPNRLANL
jgi:site-specific recombinase XerD